MLIHERLRAEREARRWSLAYLADRMGVARATVGTWERNSRNPSIRQVDAWAAEFGLRVGLVPAVDLDGATYDRLAAVVEALGTLVECGPDLAAIVNGLTLARSMSTPDEPAPEPEMVLA